MQLWILRRARSIEGQGRYSADRRAAVDVKKCVNQSGHLRSKQYQWGGFNGPRLELNERFSLKTLTGVWIDLWRASSSRLILWLHARTHNMAYITFVKCLTNRWWIGNHSQTPRAMNTIIYQTFTFLLTESSSESGDLRFLISPLKPGPVVAIGVGW